MIRSLLSAIVLIVMLNAVTSASAQPDLLEVEAAPADITISTVGPRRTIDYIDEDVTGKSDFLALFTEQYGSDVLVKRWAVAVKVDASGRVLRVVSPSVDGNMPDWEDEQQLTVPSGGYVLLAFDGSWATKDHRKFLAMNFRPGDQVALRRAGEIVPVASLLTDTGPKMRVVLTVPPLLTSIEPAVQLTGRLHNYRSGTTHRLMANDYELPVADDGTFDSTYPLSPGTNVIDVIAYQGEEVHDVKSTIVYYKEKTVDERQEVFLWIEQGPNARRFQTPESIYNTLRMAKEAGITAIALDVKGIEGFAAYKMNDLTGRPYVSNITSPTRAGANPDLDLLAEFIRHGHDLGLKVHASLNATAEGSIAHNAFAVLNRHLDWEEVIYRPEDNGARLRLRDSHYGRSNALVAFINPAHPEARDYQLRSFEEVIKNYDIDGIIVDRGRYDNDFADFSDISRTQFEAFLAERGIELNNWPDDVFVYENNVRVDGPLIDHWYTYRAGVIKDFMADLRSMVDAYNERDGRNVQLSAYVGSWYETYYRYGANWASTQFEYDERFMFPQESLYGDDYRETSYLDYLDFVMIGTYQDTPEQISHYITLGNVVTNGELPVYPGMALANVREPAVLTQAFQAGLELGDGLMIFDLTQANFPMIEAALLGTDFVKPYQLGVSHPRDPAQFIDADYLNVNRNEDNINVYTADYGPSTNTSTWGVEVIVDETGKVRRVVNKIQAMFWSWTGVEQNNSLIPPGGFVISTEDPSGHRHNRQLIANAYRVGDSVRAALLSGLSAYDGMEVATDRFELSGRVEAIGPGSPEVAINGVLIEVRDDGSFSVPVRVTEGQNAITVVVWVDGMKTNEQTVTLIGNQ